MQQELADESEYQGMEMNKSKRNVMVENDTPIYMSATIGSRTLNATSTWDRESAPET